MRCERLLDGLAPAEGKPLSLWDEELAWRYQRTAPSESKVLLIRANPYFANLTVTYTFGRWVAPRAGIYRFRLWLAGTGVVTINGKKVFSERRIFNDSNHEFEAELREGANDCTILLANAAVNATMNAFRIVAEDAELREDLPLLLAGPVRTALERDFSGFYLGNSTVRAGQKITVCWDTPVESPGSFHFTLKLLQNLSPAHIVLEKSLPLRGTASSVELMSAEELPEFTGDSMVPAASYVLNIDYIPAPPERIQGVRLELDCIRFFAELPGGADYKKRQRHLLEEVAKLALDGMAYRVPHIYRELARLETGAPVDLGALLGTIDFINRRGDCADFAFHALLRIYYKHRDHAAITPEVRDAMKACILGFKYSMEEGGRSMMYMQSENHRILFHSAEYLAGLLFPNDNFTNSNQNGLFHSLKGRWNVERWLKEKGTYGFEEWHSNCYYEEDLVALLSLYDFEIAKGQTGQLAEKVLDFMTALLACQVSNGVLATTHGRSYPGGIMHPEMEPMSRIHWVLFGVPRQLYRRLSIGSVALATSRYVPSPAWEKIATDARPLLTRTRMGYFPYKGCDPGVNISTYRTKHYMVSGVVESMKGRQQLQAQAGEVFLDGQIPVFITSFESRAPNATPSYWGGQCRMPKTVTYRNVLAMIYHNDTAHASTHCYFPEASFDRVVEKNGWLFGQKNGAYVAVRSLKPYERTRGGEYRGRELLCTERDNTWLLEAGSIDEWPGGFDAFVEKIAAAPVEIQGNDMTYHSPSIGKLELGWDRPCTRDGKPILDEDFPLIDNPHAQGEYGTGLITFHLDGTRQVLDFRM